MRGSCRPEVVSRGRRTALPQPLASLRQTSLTPTLSPRAGRGSAARGLKPEGEAAGYRFALNSVVDVGARTCDTRIDVTRAHDGDTFTERHRQYFHGDVKVRDALIAAGFALPAMTDEYTNQPPAPSTMRATWTTRYHAA